MWAVVVAAERERMCVAAAVNQPSPGPPKVCVFVSGVTVVSTSRDQCAKCRRAFDNICLVLRTKVRKAHTNTRTVGNVGTFVRPVRDRTIMQVHTELYRERVKESPCAKESSLLGCVLCPAGISLFALPPPPIPDSCLYLFSVVFDDDWVRRLGRLFLLSRLMSGSSNQGTDGRTAGALGWKLL